MAFRFGEVVPNVHHVGREEQVALWRADGFAFDTIAEANGVSSERIRQLEAKYLRLVRGAISHLTYFPPHGRETGDAGKG